MIPYNIPSHTLSDDKMRKYNSHGILRIPLDDLQWSGFEVQLYQSDTVHPPRNMWCRRNHLVLSSGIQTSPASSIKLNGSTSIDSLIVAPNHYALWDSNPPPSLFSELVARGAFVFPDRHVSAFTVPIAVLPVYRNLDE